MHRRCTVESKHGNSLSDREGNLQDEEEWCFPASSIQCNCFSYSKHKGREKQLALNCINKLKAYNLLFSKYTIWLGIIGINCFTSVKNICMYTHMPNGFKVK